jgi:hypothetical protein
MDTSSLFRFMSASNFLISLREKCRGFIFLFAAFCEHKFSLAAPLGDDYVINLIFGWDIPSRSSVW